MNSQAFGVALRALASGWRHSEPPGIGHVTIRMLLALLLLVQNPAIERLGHEDIDVRAQADAELAARGADVMPDLLNASGHDDPEVRARVFALIARLRPLEWIVDHLDEPLARSVFHACHRRHLVENWEFRTERYLRDHLRTNKGFVRAADLEASSRWSGQAILRIGEMRHPDAVIPEGQIWVDPADGGIVVHPACTPPAQPFCSLLLERLLRDPSDGHAASLLADLVDAPLAGALSRALERPDNFGRAAFEVLTLAAAKGHAWPADERPYLAALERRLRNADWGVIARASAVAVRRPKTLAPLLRASYSSDNRWARYLAAAVAHATKELDLHDRRLFDLMREDQPVLQREALFAAFAISPRATMDFAAMVQAAIAQKDQKRAIKEFRKIPERRLGLELVRTLPSDHRLALAILDVFEDDEVIGAFCDAVQLDAGNALRYLPLLAKYADEGKRERPVLTLKACFEACDESDGTLVAKALAGILRTGAIDFFESHLACDFATIRRRAVEGLYRTGMHLSRNAPDHARLVRILSDFAAAEPDEETREYARTRLRFMTEVVRHSSRVVGRRNLVARAIG